MGKLSCMRKLDIFEELTEQELENVAEYSRKRQLEPGEFLFQENYPIEAINILTEGRIKLSKFSFEGKELILGFATKNAVFGEEALFSDQNYSMNAEVVENSCVTVCSKDSIEKLFLEKPEIAIKVIRSLSQKLNQSNEQISELAFRNVRERLLNSLQRLSKNYGHKTNQGWKLDIRLTHSDLASIINASRVTVTQTISNLRKDGIIDMDENGILLKKDIEEAM